MILKDLITEFRFRVNDDLKPYDWSDAWCVSHLNEAQIEACERALLLYEIGKPLQQSVKANKYAYDLNPNIIKLDRVKYNGKLLNRMTLQEADYYYPSWEDTTETPVSYVEDGQTRKVFLIPVPKDDGLLLFSRYYRRPNNELTSVNDEPEIPRHHHMALIHWLIFMAKSQPDEDNYNQEMAASALQEFNNYFGSRPGAKDEVIQAHWRGFYNTCTRIFVK